MQQLILIILSIYIFFIPVLSQTEGRAPESSLPAATTLISNLVPQPGKNSDTASNTRPILKETTFPAVLKGGAIISKSAISQQPRLLREVYHNASVILSGDNPCSRFFGGGASREALDHLFENFRLVSTTTALGIKMSGHNRVLSNPKSGLTYRIFERAELNQRGAFFQTKRFPEEPIVPKVGSFQPATPEARVLMVLHELGHTILGGNGRWLLPDDGGDASLSSENTATIERECGRQIRRMQTQRHN